MRKTHAASVMVTATMYADNTYRDRVWATLPTMARTGAREQGLIPLSASAWNAHCTYLRVEEHDGGLTYVATNPDDATYVYMTAEIDCEELDAAHR
jgi:hypothetical protein